VERLTVRLSLLGLLLLADAAGAEPERHSTHGAPFLRAGVHARYFGMGGIGAAAANDLGAGYWNPAGLTALRGFSVTGMLTADLDQARRHAYAAAAYGNPDYVLAVSWITAGTEDIPGTDASGAHLGDFDFTENALLVSIARRGNAVSVGATGKLVTQDLGTDAPGGGDADAMGAGLDLGAQFFLTEFLRLGISAQDLFLHVGNASTDDLDKIPANLRFGVSLEPAVGLLLGFDLEKTRDEEPYRLHAGGEYQVPLANDVWGTVRAGVDDGRFAGGFGAQVGFAELDYAYVVEREAFLDENHRVSITLDFGHEREVVREGLPSDRDRDGFPDDQDACPDQPEDFDGFDDYDGCADADNDDDGIPDAQDGCPNEHEDFDGVDDDDGCPE
jgi:hypothetical protein